MATGENISLEDGHEFFYEFSCSLCEDDGKQVEAVKYCEECFVYLCEPCLREKQNKCHKRHRLKNQSQFASVKKSPLVSFPTKRCSKHPGELINIFCGNHDVVCCSACKKREHSSCLKTQHLTDAAEGMGKTQELQCSVAGIRTLVCDVDKVLNDRKADLYRIAKEKHSVRQTIADFRKKVKKYFDDLEKNSLAELDQREQMIVSRFEKDKKYLESTKSKAKAILKQLELFKGDNECDLFVQVKTGLQFLNDAMAKIRVIGGGSIQFEINRHIEEYISSLKSFGSFSIKPDNCEAFNIMEKSDTEICNISSICQLQDDILLITDVDNKKVKRLGHLLKLLDSVKLSGRPHSVCAAGPGQAAVSLTNDKKIQLVSIGKQLTLTRSFTVGNYCRGIVSIGNDLFVSCGSYTDPFSYGIEVYNNGGQLQCTLPRDQRRLSFAPEYIVVSDDDQHLFVTSFSSDVITMLDLTGKVVNKFRHKNLLRPEGICTNGRGEVLVCGYKSNTVVQLSPQNQKIEVILKEEDGINNPQGVYYDRKHSRLYVSCVGKNELFVFTLK